MLSGAVSAEPRVRLRRVVGEPSRNVSAAFLRVDALGDLRIVTAASLRVADVLRAAGARVDVLLRAAGALRLAVEGAADLGVLLFAVLVARGLRDAATGFADFTVRPVVPLAAVLRPVAVVRDLAAAVVRVVDAARVAPRFAATGFATRVEVRAVDFAAVARPRVAGAAAALRTGALRVAVARLVVARVVVALARVVGAFAVLGAEVLEAARLELLVVLAVDLAASFLAALDRAAGLFAVRIVRDVALRPVDAAVRRPPALTAMALTRRPGVLLLSSLLMV
jgi:hypothetical protein